MSSKTDIATRIQRLLDTGEDFKKQGSIDLANQYLAKAAALMDKYRLSEADVLSYSTTDSIQELHLSYYVRQDHSNWRTDLAAVLAKHNYCKAYFISRTKTIKFVGQAQDLEVVQYMYEFASTALREACKRDYAEFKAKVRQQVFNAIGLWVSPKGLFDEGLIPSHAVFYREHLSGAVRGLKDALAASRLRMSDEDRHACTSLMSVASSAIDEYIAAKYTVRDSKTSRTTQSCRAAREAGYEAGNSLQINKGVSQGPRRNVTKSLE